MKYIKPYEKNQILRYLIAQMSLFLPSILQEKTKFNELIHQQQMDRKKHYGIGEAHHQKRIRKRSVEDWPPASARVLGGRKPYRGIAIRHRTRVAFIDPRLRTDATSAQLCRSIWIQRLICFPYWTMTLVWRVRVRFGWVNLSSVN